MSAWSVTTYADGFGCWHADVTIGGNRIGDDNAAHAMAESAIAAEILTRDSRAVLFGVTLTERVSRDGTLTYYYVETDPS